MKIHHDDMPNEGFHSFKQVAPGWYQVEVSKFDEDYSDRAACVDLEIINGTHKDSIGLNHRHFFAKSQKSMKYLLAFAAACGLTTEEKILEAKKQKKEIDIDFNMSEGRTLIVRIQEEADEDGKERSRIKFDDFFREDDPQVKDVPKSDMEAAKQDDDLTPF
jgi:hypothetical protein